MAIVTKLMRVNNLMQIIYDDGTRQFAYPSGSTIWFPGSGDTPPDPEPGSTFKWPFPADSWTTYPDHSGLDFAQASGTPIKCIGDGVVHAVYDTTYNTTGMGLAGANEPIWRGICVVVNHGAIDGHTIWSLYAHMSSRAVNVGNTVTGGQVIGTVGNTGYSFGNHLHFEVIYDGARLTNSMGGGAERAEAWMNAHTDGSNW